MVERRAGSAVSGASRGALLSQLSRLSADEAQNLTRRALNSKHSAQDSPRIEVRSGHAIAITEEMQKLALLSISAPMPSDN